LKWVIGSGAYLSEIEAVIEQKQQILNEKKESNEELEFAVKNLKNTQKKIS